MTVLVKHEPHVSGLRARERANPHWTSWLSSSRFLNSPQPLRLRHRLFSRAEVPRLTSTVIHLGWRSEGGGGGGGSPNPRPRFAWPAHQQQLPRSYWSQNSAPRPPGSSHAQQLLTCSCPPPCRGCARQIKLTLRARQSQPSVHLLLLVRIIPPHLSQSIYPDRSVRRSPKVRKRVASLDLNSNPGEASNDVAVLTCSHAQRTRTMTCSFPRPSRNCCCGRSPGSPAVRPS